MSRGGHISKNAYEKKRYVDDVRSSFLTDEGTLPESNTPIVDDTIKSKDTPNKSNDPNYSSEEDKNRKRPVSFRTKSRIFFKNNWVVTVAGGLIVLVLWFVGSELFTTAIFRVTIAEKMLKIDENINSLKGDVKDFTIKVDKSFDRIQEKVMEQIVQTRLNSEKINNIENHK